MSVTENSPGMVSYTVTCTGAPPAATASVVVDIKSAAAATAAPSSKGGGGALNLWSLLILALFAGLRSRAHLLWPAQARDTVVDEASTQ